MTTADFKRIRDQGTVSVISTASRRNFYEAKTSVQDRKGELYFDN